MASNTNYTSITDLLSSFTPVERPTRVHYNPFPEIERMNRSYQYYRYPGDQPQEEAVEEAPVEEAPVEEAPVEEAPVEEAPVEEAPVEEASNKFEKKNLNGIINSREFKLFLSKYYDTYFDRFNKYKWNENGSSNTYINDINNWLSEFDLNDSKFPIVTTQENWDADIFTQDMPLSSISELINQNLFSATPLLRQIYITIEAVNDYLKSSTPPPSQDLNQNPTHEQPKVDQDTDQGSHRFINFVINSPYKVHQI